MGNTPASYSESPGLKSRIQDLLFQQTFRVHSQYRRINTGITFMIALISLPSTSVPTSQPFVVIPSALSFLRGRSLGLRLGILRSIVVLLSSSTQFQG